ncbi:MAG: hypothetical protein ACRD41_15140 [Candidatus Acidiferrales bacterium]
MSSRYISVCPISTDYNATDSLAPLVPIKITDSIFVENISEIIRQTPFKSLTPHFLSETEAAALRRTQYALVRHFDCAFADRPAENERSANLLYQLYLGLKVIRPTAGKFLILHYDLGTPSPRLPDGSRNDYGTIVCDYERLNRIRQEDIQELAALAPLILGALKSAPNPIAQAVHNLEVGYRTDFAYVRHLLWVVGLDSLVTSQVPKRFGKGVAVPRITSFLEPTFQIYPEKGSPGFDLPILPDTTLQETIGDIYDLRNSFAHGDWPDKARFGQICRRSLDGTEDIDYSTVLCEAASSILRGCLKKILADVSTVEIFNHKSKMNAYFDGHLAASTGKPI